MGVDKNCTEVEIKKSYIKLAVYFHPDKKKAVGAQDAFKNCLGVHLSVKCWKKISLW